MVADVKVYVYLLVYLVFVTCKKCMYVESHVSGDRVKIRRLTTYVRAEAPEALELGKQNLFPQASSPHCAWGIISQDCKVVQDSRFRGCSTLPVRLASSLCHHSAPITASIHEATAASIATPVLKSFCL